MKMEAVLEELRNWGEVLITTDGGQSYELHLGDTEFDLEARVIRIKGAHALYVISGDAVESVTKHYGHPLTDEH